MPAGRSYHVEHPEERRTDIPGRPPPWTNDVDRESIEYPNNDSNTPISFVGWNGPPEGSFKKRNGTNKDEITKSREHYMKVKGCLFAFLTISAIVAVGVTIALVVVLTQYQKETESSTTPSPLSYESVQYLGELTLLEEWIPAMDDPNSPEYTSKLRDISEQIDRAFMSSILWRYYNHSEVLSLRKGSIISSFYVIFNSMREYTPLDNDMPLNVTVSPQLVASVFLDQIARGFFGLPLNTSSILISQVMSTSAVVSTTPMMSSSASSMTTESSMTTDSGQCALLEFPLCGQLYNYTTISRQNQSEAVTRFSQYFQYYLNQNCSSRALNVFCAFQFTICDPVTGEPVLPCRQLCEAVNSDCSLGLPCAGLPNDTSICYNGSDIPPSTKTTSPVTTVSPPSTTPGQCALLEFPLCGQLYNYTTIPLENQSEAVTRFNQVFTFYLNQNCSTRALSMFCAFSFKKCDPMTGTPVLPCQQLCEVVNNDCRLELPCAGLPNDTSVCYNGSDVPPPMKTTSPVTTLSPPSTTPGRCALLEFPLCGQLYHYTTIPLENQSEAVTRFNQVFTFYLNQNCSTRALSMFCAFSFKKCDPMTGTPVLPCQQLCEAVNNDCRLGLPCAGLPNDTSVCYNGSDVPPSMKTTSPVTTLSPPSTTPGQCALLEFPLCGQLYNYTTIPLENQSEAVTRFTQVFTFYLNQNCSTRALSMFCAFSFKKCDSTTGTPVLPCQQLCEAVNNDCRLGLPCAGLPNDTSVCYNGSDVPPSMKTTSPVTTLSPPSTTPGQCALLEFPLCSQLYNYTTIPLENQSEAVTRFNQVFTFYLNQNCSTRALSMFCAFSFKKCDPMTGTPVLPCQQLCEAVNNDCSLGLPCAGLPNDTSICYNGSDVPPPMKTTSPVTTLSPPSTTPGQCALLEFPLCGQLYNYTTISLQNQSEAVTRFNQYFSAILNQGCSPWALPMFCSFSLNKCDPTTGQSVPPCRQLCEVVNVDCNLALPCSQLPTTACYDGGYSTPVATTTEMTTPDLGFCSAGHHPICKKLYPATVLFANQNATARLERFESYLPIIDANCSSYDKLFLCSNTFPQCDPKVGLPFYPCQDLCSAFMNGCGTRFNLNYQCGFYFKPGSDCISIAGVPTSAPPTTTSKIESTSPVIQTTPAPSSCEAVTLESCSGLLSYGATSFPNTLQHLTQNDASTAFTQLTATSSKCHQADKTLLCSLLFPRCSNGRRYPLCRAACQSLSPECVQELNLDCKQLPFDDDPNVCTMTPVNDAWASSNETALCIGLYCYNGNCLTDTSLVCNGIDECGDFTDELFCAEVSTADCDFEDGTLCNYVQATTDGVDWIRNSGSTPSLNTGPRHDRTYTNMSGHYLYLEGTGVAEGSVAQLILPEKSWVEHCFRMSYSIRGTGIGSLKILTSKQRHLRWVADGTLGNKWKSVAITLPKGVYSIFIEGVRGPMYTSDVAVDNLVSRNGPCPTINSTCEGDHFFCNSTGLCIHPSKRCDTVNDCGDYSDEMGCDCSATQYYFQCAHGNCIKSFMRCDNKTDCPDGSDELNCVCPNGQAQCPDGTCIMSEWLCDGDWDCKDGSDEDNCLRCGRNEHTCQDYKCVSEQEVCDGVHHCQDRSDESYCVRRRSWDHMLEVRSGLSWVPVCASSWDASLGETICDMIGEGSYNSTFRINHASSTYLTLQGQVQDQKSWIKNLMKGNSCEDAAVVGINCKTRPCGTRSVGFVSSYIVGGSRSTAGKWPWMASFTFQGTHECGGTLISPEFVLTAAHCIKRYVNFPFLLKIVLGATTWGSSQPHRKTLPVKRVIPHPEFFAFAGHDIGLIQLQSPVDYDEYISPACLPDDQDHFSTNALCFVAGWGQTEPGSGVVAQLREAKIKLWQTSKCNSSLAWNGSLSRTDFCAGYISGSIGTCHGDSGGPLVCRDQTKRWKVVGISSYVIGDCRSPGFPPVFTDVQKLLSWIRSNTECKFRCDNGQCLYETGLICNRRNDCGDNSDETRVCQLTLNCTFDDPFLCGYEPKNWFARTGLDRALPLPFFDHTLGVQPGKYMASNGVGTLESPKFTLSSTHCVRFYYNYITSDVTISGLPVLNGDFSTSVDFFGPGDFIVRKEMFRAPNRSDTEMWRVASFELPAGTFRVIFHGYLRQVVSLDDVSAVPGSCGSNLGCPSGEYQCQTGCIPESAKCNLAVNCGITFSDEMQVCSVWKAYNCTFENNAVCGVNREYGTETNRWALQNGTTAYNVQSDHTLGTGQGHFMYSGAGQSSTFTVVLVQPMNTYCLQMYYQIYGDQAHLQLEASWTLQAGLQVQQLWNATGLRNTAWNRVLVNLPKTPYLILKFAFAVPGRQQSDDKTFAALDDILVNEGTCPEFTCPSGTKKCQDEDYCLDEKKFCDRVADCRDYSDENNCTCSQEEFQCSDGCIQSTLTCNGVVDCRDKTDEGEICDSMRSPSCAFEGAFLCGYQLGSVGRFIWVYHRGSTQSRRTGPDTDHTFQNLTGHFLYTEASVGEHKDMADATSPEFTAGTGDHLMFYYHMRGEDVGELAVLATQGPDSAPKRIWDVSGNHGDIWLQACLPLPSGPRVTFTFSVARGAGPLGDVAIDDVTVISQPCPAVTTAAPGIVPTTVKDKCLLGERPCDMGLCLNSAMFCNGFFDCPDNSDEYNCPQPTMTPQPMNSTATPEPECPENYFQCQSWWCILDIYVCNGYPDCPDGSDEGYHCVNCTEVQYQCASGQCVPASARCDSRTDCRDRTDETGCPCSGVGFRCSDGLCISLHYRCDHVMDCLDMSDELDCVCNFPRRTCDNGFCVDTDKWCDGYDDCRDNTDEKECPCTSEQTACLDGRCIMKDWLCDGYEDCVNGTDEDHCDACTGEEFTCLDYSCIDKDTVCDGEQNCLDSSDERHCVTLELGDSPHSGVVSVKHEGKYKPICMESWREDIADSVCSQLGLGPSLFSSSVAGSGDAFLSIRQNYSSSHQLQLNVRSSTCPSKRVINLDCQPKECGLRSRNLTTVSTFIIGGNVAAVGDWPWVVSLQRLGASVCGGALINREWVITAAHCLHADLPFYYDVLLGTTNIMNPGLHARKIKVEKIVQHPSFFNGNGTQPANDDLAMLKLKDPIEFSDFVLPVCLPGLTDKDFPLSSHCFVTGWGKLRPEAGSGAVKLREAKLRLWNSTNCQRAYKGRIMMEGIVCAGYDSGWISSCEGDSGGPLMCLDQAGHWTLAGLLSSGQTGCPRSSPNRPVLPNLFSKVTAYSTWIEETSSAN